MSDFCQVHLGRNGPSYTTTDSALVKFRDEQSKSMVHGFLINPDQQREQLNRLRTARFFSFRDGSAAMSDQRSDGDPVRRARWLSPTRDMMRGPVWDRPLSHELYTVNDNSVPGFGRYVDAGVDTSRFIDEVDALMKRGMVTELPDFESDDSMIKLFGRINDIALEEAKARRIDQNQSNRVIDAAPGLYLFSELLKRTNRLVEEDFTELWARRIFPILNLNTWMPQWLFQRIDDRGTLPSYVDVERLPANAPRGNENRDGEVRNLAYWHHAASWSKLELMRFAEAAANGAPNLNLNQRRINNAIRMMNFKEDLITFAGDTDVDILGLFSAEASTGIERIASATYGGAFGSGTPEVDRDLLIGAVKQVFIDTEAALKPDTIMLSTESWAHVTTRLYGTVDSDAGTNKTVLEMAMPSLEKLGIKDILCVSEVGYSVMQRDRLVAHGLTTAQAQVYAGGIGDAKQAMVICKRDAEVMEMVVAKDRVMYPAQETRTDRVETRMLQGGGGLAVYKPGGCKIVTDVGPN